MLTPPQEIAATILRQRLGPGEVVAHETWGTSVVVEQWDHLNASPESLAVTFRDLAGLLRRLHAIRLEGFGWIDHDLRGLATSWNAWVREEIAKAAHVLDAHLCSGFANHADRVVRDTLGEPEHALLNADLNLSEVFVDEVTGKVTGIVDWANAAVGDPLLDLATFAFGGPAGDSIPPRYQPRLLEAYATEVDEPRAAVYQALNHLWNACWCVVNGLNAWIPDLAAEAEQLLDHP